MNLWCLGVLSTLGFRRLTADVPGFVAGVAAQTLLPESHHIFCEKKTLM